MTVPDPETEKEPWPTLGPLVCKFIETRLVFGPGDLRGQKAALDAEKRGLIYRFYEVFPKGAKDVNGKLIEGRRRFRRCAVSLQKGSAKTELAAWIAAVELHPEGPVRFDSFDGHGRPTGRPVIDPYIPMVAYTEEQTEDLAYAALKTILELSPVVDDFDIGLERILRKGGGGKAVALASAPDARDGARTTFAHKDETHRWNLPRLKRAHRTMLANLPKRLLADPWELETTTAYSPGEGSVTEETAEYARAVADSRAKDTRLFFFHRQAADNYDLNDPRQLREAVLEAAGPTAPWRDIDGIVEQWQDPTADFAYLERVYLNRPVQASAQAFDAKRWKELEKPKATIPAGELVTLGFDGARHHDGTDLVATGVKSGLQILVGHWEPPATSREEWDVPAGEVDAAVVESFERWNVWRMYADPYWWEGYLAEWQGKYGDDKVLEWRTNRYRPMAYALQAYKNAMTDGEVSHDGNSHFARAIGNACRQELTFTDDAGKRLWVIQKERPDSPNKIDAAMAGCLSWEARNDAIAAGALEEDEYAGVMIL